MMRIDVYAERESDVESNARQREMTPMLQSFD